MHNKANRTEQSRCPPPVDAAPMASHDTAGMDKAVDCVTAYCKAQACINKIENENDATRRELVERIRTQRSMLHDALVRDKATCVEVYHESDAQPVLFRLQPAFTHISLNSEIAMNLLTNVDNSQYDAHAEKCGHDVPKMLSNILRFKVREMRAQQPQAKMRLVIDTPKQRENDATCGDVASRDAAQRLAASPLFVESARDLLDAREQLNELRQLSATQKQDHMQTQKQVTPIVRRVLTHDDPDTQMKRVQIQRDGKEWMYYLRCKDVKKTKHMGVRRVAPLLEQSVANVLTANGLSREYLGIFQLNALFWSDVRRELDALMAGDALKQQPETKITLDRGPPRRKKKKSDAPVTLGASGTVD